MAEISMFGWQERLRRLAVLGVLVLAHIGVVALIAMSSRNSPATVQIARPLAVDLISEAPQPEQWRPPPPVPVVASIVMPTPETPLIEVPEPITAELVPVATSAISDPGVSAKAERSAPRAVLSVEYLREPIPRYPPQSRKLREQGLVMLRVIIDEHGAASQVEVERSSGYVRLDQAAREAVLRASFRPYNEGGIPQPALVLIPIEFSLSQS